MFLIVQLNSRFLMGFSALFLIFSSYLYAVEVTTLDTSKTATEFVVISTDNNFSSDIEKQYLAQACRPRISINGNLKEFAFANSCRAEVTKFILNNGFKPDQLFRTFTK